MVSRSPKWPQRLRLSDGQDGGLVCSRDLYPQLSAHISPRHSPSRIVVLEIVSVCKKC